MVPYEIHFLRVPAGRTYDEVLDDINAAYDPDADPEPMRLTAGQRAVWERLVRRVGEAVGGPVECEEYPSCLTLCRTAPPGYLQLDYDGDSAALQVAYRHAGPDARRAAEELYRVARMVEAETGLQGYDGQAGQPVATGAVDRAAAALGGVSRWAQENLT
ncbi:hypothetical protein GCM10010218_29690 [Streptomyces mashuensis]|uniref:Uncharacterized protein n=1 Tax=Streptomyces mashuensis TaxID=33904 RepID=A0A919B3E7_9ACTN|nr:hypothetical protein [Streptomyces mashuensis]GHF46473.1 hypothetical protein GCM10010218_29690 [Streptomyces mashuensis]